MSYKLEKLRGIEWIELSKIHINSATILFNNGGNMGIVCYHIQQAMEKSLKGYILMETGILVDGHSLINLVTIASQNNFLFQQFVEDAPYISSFYIEDNYPCEDPALIGEKEVEYVFKVYYKMYDAVEQILNEVYI